jgi:hypothetical protein
MDYCVKAGEPAALTIQANMSELEQQNPDRQIITHLYSVQYMQSLPCDLHLQSAEEELNLLSTGTKRFTTEPGEGITTSRSVCIESNTTLLRLQWFVFSDPVGDSEVQIVGLQEPATVRGHWAV